MDDFTREMLRSACRGRLPVFGRPAAYLPIVTDDDAVPTVRPPRTSG